MLLTIIALACGGSSFDCADPSIDCSGGGTNSDDSLESDTDTDTNTDNRQWIAGSYPLTGEVWENNCGQIQDGYILVVEDSGPQSSIGLVSEDWGHTFQFEACQLNGSEFDCASINQGDGWTEAVEINGQFLSDGPDNITFSMEFESNDGFICSMILNLWSDD